MTALSSEPVSEPDRLSAARRRRAQRMLTQLRADERESFLETLAHQLSPSIDLFLYTLLAAILIGLGFRFDQRALILAGALVAPRMGPVAGLALAAVSGSLRFFLRLLASLVVSLVLLGAIAGVAGGLALPEGTSSVLAAGHAKLNLIDFGLLIVGAALLALGRTATRPSPMRSACPSAPLASAASAATPSFSREPCSPACSISPGRPSPASPSWRSSGSARSPGAATRSPPPSRSWRSSLCSAPLGLGSP